MIHPRAPLDRDGHSLNNTDHGLAKGIVPGFFRLMIIGLVEVHDR